MESDIWLRFQGQKVDEELFILTGAVQDTINNGERDDEEWQGFITKTK